jgi:hypothetical protein
VKECPLEKIEQAANDLCDMLESEWEQGDGVPDKAVWDYTRACEALNRTPIYMKEAGK